jgi:serine/threonine protein phosphatase PrpC
MTPDRHGFIDALHFRLFSWFEREPARRRGWQGSGEGSVGVATDIGPEREENQDRAAITRFSASDGVDYLLAIVCDGMGGMAYGGECASLAISAFIVGFLKNHRAGLEDRLRSAAEQANVAVHRLYAGKGGSTLSAFCSTGVTHMGVNVGDSRIYCRSGGALKLITTDDTLAAHRQSSQADPGSRSLLQYIGIGHDLVAHVVTIPTECEVVLVTSDGAHSIPDDALEALARHAQSPFELTRRLVQTAQWMGSRDNGTAVCVNVFALGQIPQIERAVWLSDAGGELHILNPTDSRSAAAPDPAQGNDVVRTGDRSDSPESRRPVTKRNRTRKKSESKAKVRPERPSVQVEITEILEPPAEGET